MRVGSELKVARKKAGISVEVISKRTKIQVSKLVALEKNDFKNLPTGLYLFAAVRAYAREVHIDPAPIVERLRAEFADKDALDALHALDATGALNAKNQADPGRSKNDQSNLLRNAAIAAGVVLMAAAVATAVDVRQQAAGAADRSAPTNTHRPKSRTAAVIPGLQETVTTAGAVSEESAETPANVEEPKPDAPVVATEP